VLLAEFPRRKNTLRHRSELHKAGRGINERPCLDGSVATFDWRSMGSQELSGEPIDAQAQAANSKSLLMN
jgi:hypothetical protein